jgi:heat shock protein HtpX
MMKRVFLFLATNLAILASVSIVLSVLSALGVFDPRVVGGQLGLLMFCFVYGMVAAFVSLGLSRVVAKWMLGVKLIDGRSGNAELDWLYNAVENLARQAGLPTPQVGIYDSPEVNAFATGPTRKRSLVAVSSGLLRSMQRSEIEGVLGHELTHVANGDMVTMTLLQGVINAFVLYLAFIVRGIVRQALSSRDDGGPSLLAVIAGEVMFFAAQIVFGIIGSTITAWYSRRREFRADAGGARLAGRGSMIAALRRLQSTKQLVDTRNAALASFKIAGAPRGLRTLIATHPPLSERIAALEHAS